MKCPYCGKAGNFDMVNHLKKSPPCQEKHKEKLMQDFNYVIKKRIERINK